MIHDLNYDLIFHCSHNLLWVPEYECAQCLEYSGCITLDLSLLLGQLVQYLWKGEKLLHIPKGTMELADYIYSKNYVKSFTYMSTYDSLKHRICIKPFLQKSGHLLSDFLHAFCHSDLKCLITFGNWFWDLIVGNRSKVLNFYQQRPFFALKNYPRPKRPMKANKGQQSPKTSNFLRNHHYSM